MCHDFNLSQLTNRVDLDGRVVLAVALGALVLLAALLLEDDHLGTAAVVDDRAGDLRALDRRGADERSQLDRVAGLRVERRDADGAALFDAELLAAGTYDCVSHFSHSSHTDGPTRLRKVLHYKDDTPPRQTHAAPFSRSFSGELRRSPEAARGP